MQVMEAAGWRVRVPTEPLCCGLTLLSTGQLSLAKRVLRRSVDRLSAHVAQGGLVVGLEPSCTAVFRSDATELFPRDWLVEQLRHQTVTLAGLLTEHSPGWTPPPVPPPYRKAPAQVHCHQHAVLGWDAEAQLLDSARVEAEQLASGCCGLAGNFGFEPGHRAVSEACAERVLLPAVRNAPDDTVILADGFSCRTQIHELDSGGREAVHLAELLCAAIDGASPARGRGGPAPAEAAHPEDALAIRPTVLHQAGGLTRRRGPAPSMRSRAPAR